MHMQESGRVRVEIDGDVVETAQKENVMAAKCVCQNMVCHECGLPIDTGWVEREQLAAERARCEALLHAVQAHGDSPLELIDDDIAAATLAIREAIKERTPVTPADPGTQPKGQDTKGTGR